MKLIGPLLVALAAILLLAGFFLIVRIPADEVGVTDTGRPGEVPQSLKPGFHLRPFGSSVVTYSTLPASATGEAMVTPASGGEIPVHFTVTGRLDPDRAGALHAAMGGAPLENFLSSQTGILLREYAVHADAVDVLTPEYRAGAAQDIATAMERGGLSEVSISIKPADDETLLAAAQYLAPRREAGRIRSTITEALAEPGGSGSWKLQTAMGLTNESEKLFAQAEKNYLDALAIDPAALPPMAQLVTLYSAVGEWDKLARILDAALTSVPSSLQHINWMAMALLKREDLAAAERILNSGLAIEPANTTLLANLGALYMKMNRTEDAISRFQKAVDSAPGNQQALFNLGSALAATGRFSEALPYLERAGEAGTMTQPLARTLAFVHEKLGNQEKAASYRQKAKQLEAPQELRKKNAPPSGTDHAAPRPVQAPS